MWWRRSWFSLKGKAGIPGQTEGCPATSIGPRVLPVGSLQQREVRLIAATATWLRPPAMRELGRVSRERWTALRQRLDHRRHARTLRTRFRRNPDAYLAALEQRKGQPILPT